MSIINTLRSLLSKVVDEIDAGNTDMTEKDMLEAIDFVRKCMDKSEKLSKYQACRYLNMSRATFDNKVREGLIPKGIKQPGFKELFWTRKQLDRYIAACKEKDLADR